MIDDTALRNLAEGQHALVTTSQMVDLGFGSGTRSRLVDGRRWERVTPRVIRLVGSPRTREQRSLAAVLDAGAGAALASTSAGAWWGISGNLLDPLQVVRLRKHSGRPTRVGTNHDPVLLPEHHVVTLDGVPTVVPARALFDIAGLRRRGAELPWWVERMERMVDTAWSKRLVSGNTLHSMLDELAQRGRPGIRVMRQVLDKRGIDYLPPASGLESRFVQILQKASARPMRRQVDTGDGGGWIGRVDFLDDELPLIVEAQSERFHSSLIDRQLDADRIARLERAGFVVVQISDTQIWQQPHAVLEAVARGRAIAQGKLHLAA